MLSFYYLYFYLITIITDQIPLLQSLENLLNVTLPDLLTPVDRQSKTDETSRTMKAIDHLRKLDFQIVALNNHISKLKEIILEAEELRKKIIFLF